MDVLGQAVTEATRAAAMRVDDRSQANGEPRIVPELAHETFREMLAHNLKLSNTNLEPREGSGIENAPSYVLLVYNGDDSYQPAYKVFREGLEGPCEVEGGFPKEFHVNDSGIYVEGEGRAIELKTPGCIAVVKADIKPIFKKETIGCRYASARIVQR